MVVVVVDVVVVDVVVVIVVTVVVVVVVVAIKMMLFIAFSSIDWIRVGCRALILGACT